jgi:hypothetical protein
MRLRCAHSAAEAVKGVCDQRRRFGPRRQAIHWGRFLSQCTAPGPQGGWARLCPEGWPGPVARGAIRRRAASSCPGIRVRALRPVRLRRPCVRRARVRGAASSASGTLVVGFLRIHYALSLSTRRRHRRRASETARGVSATPRVACLRRGGAVRIRSAAGASMTASAAPLSTKTAQRQHEEHKDSTKPVCSRRPLSSFKPHVQVAKR